MFVIADARHKVPSFLWKILPDGTALITVDLSKAPQFNTRQEAKEFLSSAKKVHTFEFKVHELTIKI
jgi:hypothetical protein